MRVEVRGLIDGRPAKLTWSDGWLAGGADAIRTVELVAIRDELDLNSSEDFFVAVERAFDAGSVALEHP